MNLSRDPRIAERHLARKAAVYARQSSPEQVRFNAESTKLQLGLRERVVALGWRDPIVIDEDLGVSASGFDERPGFQRLLALVAMREVGIIMCVDASRLSRNSKDWAHLFELCGVFDTLIADIEQIYDLRLPNDRLLMGIKGTVSEMELTILRTRMRMGAEAKAARGELRFMVPSGYVHDPEGQIVLDPDQRVHQAIVLMFEQFDRSTSARQLAMWYRDTDTRFPVKSPRHGWTILWQVPTPKTLEKLLRHPIYTGTYVYGRRATRVDYEGGRLIKRVEEALPPEKTRVVIRDHHPPFITWERFLANRAKLADNRPRWSMGENRGAIRDGLAMLVGLLRCGHCGSRVFVGYTKASANYYCDAGGVKGNRRCLSFGSYLIDRAVGEEICRALSPLAIQAAEDVWKQRNEQQSQVEESARLEVEAAQYAVDRAREQFDLVDPKNRLVAGTLEDRWNGRLVELDRAKLRLQQATSERSTLTAAQRERIQDLSRDFPELWNHPKADAALRKRLLRAAICEIIVTHKPERRELEVIIHWKGGAHTQISVYKRSRLAPPARGALVETVRQLAETLQDHEIARILNMKAMKTPGDLPWTQDRVRDFRHQHHVPMAPSSIDEDFVTGKHAAEYLGISRNALLALIKQGTIKSHQVTEYAPMRIPRKALDSDRVRSSVEVLKTTGRLPKGGCPEGQGSLFRGKSTEMKDGAL
jgi:excisionase family DNA binding protein